MSFKVSVTESIQIQRSPEEVWDFTQDYGHRMEWDPSVLEAEVLDVAPVPRVRIRAAGGFRGVFQYRQFERPKQTSLVVENVSSWLLEGGGGAWSYVAKDGGTWWT